VAQLGQRAPAVHDRAVEHDARSPRGQGDVGDVTPSLAGPERGLAHRGEIGVVGQQRGRASAAASLSSARSGTQHGGRLGAVSSRPRVWWTRPGSLMTAWLIASSARTNATRSSSASGQAASLGVGLARRRTIHHGLGHGGGERLARMKEGTPGRRRDSTGRDRRPRATTRRTGECRGWRSRGR
jgi:hypothetical protein